MSPRTGRPPKVNPRKINLNIRLTEQEAKEYFGKLKVGVFLMVRGMITTKLVPRKFKCEKCGVISEAESLITEVISYGKPVCLEMWSIWSTASLRNRPGRTVRHEKRVGH